MSKICERCGKKPVAGRSYARRGLAKSKGGVGRKITGITKRRFVPNIQIVRVVAENGAVRRARFCTRCLRTGLNDGSIQKAIRKPRAPKEAPPSPPSAPETDLAAEPEAAAESSGASAEPEGEPAQDESPEEPQAE